MNRREQIVLPLWLPFLGLAAIVWYLGLAAIALMLYPFARFSKRSKYVS